MKEFPLTIWENTEEYKKYIQTHPNNGYEGIAPVVRPSETEIERLRALFILDDIRVEQPGYRVRVARNGMIFFRPYVDPIIPFHAWDVEKAIKMGTTRAHLSPMQEDFILVGRNINLGDREGVHLLATGRDGRVLDEVWPTKISRDNLLIAASNLNELFKKVAA